MHIQNKSAIRIIVLRIIMVIIAAAAPAAGQNAIWAPPSLNQLIEEGLANNQALKSLAFQINALAEKIDPAGALPDPRLGIGMLNLPTDTFDLDQEPMTQKQIFVAQKIPWAGKRALWSEEAQWAVRQKEAILDARRLNLSKDIAAAWYDLGFITKSRQINDRMIELLDQIYNAAESRYVTGNGLQQNVFQAQVELSKLYNEQISLKARHRALEDRINALLNRKTFQPVVYSDTLPAPDMKFSPADLESLALTHNPELKIREYEISQSETRIHLAKKDFWPDIDIMAAYGQRDENRAGQDWADFFSATVSISLPVWQNRKQDRQLAAATAMRQSAEQSFENLAENITHQLDSLIFEIVSLQDNYFLYRQTLLPQAENWARSALDAYEVGEVEFDTMINAKMRLLMFELQAEKYLFDIYKKRAELEALIGRKLP
jgi:outer membrane protein TolC